MYISDAPVPVKLNATVEEVAYVAPALMLMVGVATTAIVMMASTVFAFASLAVSVNAVVVSVLVGVPDITPVVVLKFNPVSAFTSGEIATDVIADPMVGVMLLIAVFNVKTKGDPETEIEKGSTVLTLAGSGPVRPRIFGVHPKIKVFAATIVSRHAIALGNCAGFILLINISKRKRTNSNIRLPGSFLIIAKKIKQLPIRRIGKIAPFLNQNVASLIFYHFSQDYQIHLFYQPFRFKKY
jgi:hypothetical protein